MKTFILPQKEINEFCQRHHINKLSLFGSVLGDDFTPASDVDILVEFEPNYMVGMIKMAGIEIELSQILGRKVDLRTPQELSRYFREDVLKSAQVKYVAQRG